MKGHSFTVNGNAVQQGGNDCPDPIWQAGHLMGHSLCQRGLGLGRPVDVPGWVGWECKVAPTV
jgi:hypothetical protein